MLVISSNSGTILLISGYDQGGVMNFPKSLIFTIPAVLILLGIARGNYLLFHNLAELFSIVIAFGIFVIGWHSKNYYQNNYLLFIGIAYLYVAFFDTLHTLAYKGMGVFPTYDGDNLPPQLWLVARYLESFSLLIAPLFFRVRLRYKYVFAFLSVISLLALYAIFYARIFPICFIPGSGLTPFKIISEYLIDATLVLALLFLYKNKNQFDAEVLRLLSYSIICMMVTEICFTIYVHLYGLSNLIGHIFKIFSFMFMYKAIIETALTKPYNLLFKQLQDKTDALAEHEVNLKKSEERYRSIFNGMTEGFALHEILCDSQGVPVDYLFLDVNPAFEKLTGLSRATVIGKPMTEVIPGEDPVWVKRYGTVALNGQSEHFENYSPVLQKHFEVFAYQPAQHQFAVLFMDITHRKHLELELQRVMNEQKIILENTSVGISFVKNRIQQWSNPKMAEMFGYPLEMMSGINAWIFYPSQEEYDQFASAALPVLQQGAIYSSTCKMLRQNGSTFWTRVSGKAIDPGDQSAGIIWIIEDITVQKQLDDAVLQARNRLLEAQRLAHLGNWELELESHTLHCSDEVYSIFEIDSERLKAPYEAFVHAIHPDDREKVGHAYTVSQENQSPYSLKHRLLLPDGRIKHVIVQFTTTFDEAGKPLRSSGTVQDITELENSRLAAETASKVTSEFLSNMSHEIRTPMNGILGMAQLLRNSSLTERQKEQIDIIIMSGSDLMRQINDILDFARMEAEQIHLEYAPFSLKNCVHDVFKAQTALISNKGLKVSVSTAEDIPEYVIGDTFRVKQILVNLIGNALKFTEKGEVAVAISTIERDDREIVIDLAVNDTGVGIPEQSMDSIFKPFIQADGSINRRFGGSGLGLSIARKLARIMGGDICCENRPTGGSTFHFRLPCPITLSHPPEN